ncbi:MAG TPA: penicillin-binding protein 2 [Candidatus Saccharimonadales bacterium]|nr:penicillin-binding protein 2 [Candidatus Saccharimonadales bacterium]
MQSLGQNLRVSSLKFVVVVLGVLIVSRLVDLQIIQYSHYRQLAFSEHQRKYEIPAARGQIYVKDGDNKVPLALNQTLKLVYADPSIMEDKASAATKLAAVTGDPADKLLDALNKGHEYAVLKTRVDEKMAAAITSLHLRGVGMVNQDYRTYPEGSLASQALGFVNNDGDGQYGVEGFLNTELKGNPGQLNAKTDTNGVPIATTDNVIKQPTDGTGLVLTLDRNIQSQAETFLKQGVEEVKAESGSVVVLDPDTGAVKAMANYPTYDPNDYTKVADYTTFSNSVVTNQFEPGSVFKVFTMAAGLDLGKVKPDSTYTDNGCEQVSGYKVCNAENHHEGPNTTMTVVLRDSLNTGVMYILKLLGTDPNKITSTSKQSFRSFITDHFKFGKRTGIEQQGEASGYVPPPTSSDVTFANMSFGQGISTTMIQVAAAVGAIANGGKLYQPYVVAERDKADGSVQKTAPKVINPKVISKQTATDLGNMMEVVVHHGSGYRAFTPGYKIAGKTGTAQIPNPNGPGYIEGVNIGSFAGFAPIEDPKFVVMVRVNKPKVAGFAESTTVPIFANLTRWLLQYYAVPPSG